MHAPLILAIGDSLVAGYGLAPEQSFAVQMHRALRIMHPEVEVVSAGRSGDTTANVLHRLIPLIASLEARPKLAIVQVGPNDVLRQVDPRMTRDNLDRIVLELSRCGVQVLLTTVTPPPFLQQRARGYVGIHAEVASRYGATVWPFFPAGVLGHADMVLADRVHPNARAIGLVVEAMLPVVEEMLAGNGNSSHENTDSCFRV